MRYLTAVVLLLMAASPSLADQESADEFDRLLISGLFGRTTADAATLECCELRSPPALVSVEDRGGATIVGVDARLFWTARTSTFVQILGSRERNSQFTYTRPTSPSLPFQSYEVERRLFSDDSVWTAGQTFELATQNRVRPWLFGAFGVRTVAERQRSTNVGFTDPSVRIESVTEWHRRQWLVYFGLGTRINFGSRVFLGGELASGFAFAERCIDCHPLVRERLDRPRPLIVRSMAGVRF